MKLNVAAKPDRLYIKVDEERLDAAVALAFKDAMRDVVPRAEKLVALDLSRVNFMDSSGLGAVISVLKSLPEGRELELSGLTPNVERVFRLTRMDTVFRINPPLTPEVPRSKRVNE